MREEIHNWSSFGFHIEDQFQRRLNKVSLFRRLSSISNDLLDDEPPTVSNNERNTQERSQKAL